MKTIMFAIYDTKAECYNPPFFMPKKEMALRAFNDLANDGNTNISRHPEDYILYELAEFDDITGEVKSRLPVSLGHAIAKTQSQPELFRMDFNRKEKEEKVS